MSKLYDYLLDQYGIGIHDTDAIRNIVLEEAGFIKVVAKKDESGHWYVIPNDKHSEFIKDSEDDDLANSGGFDAKWHKYRTGGDLNLVQLWMSLPKPYKP